MIRISGVDHVVIRARDYERMIAFYRDVLGCPLEWRRDDLGMAHMRAGRALIDLVDVKGELGKKGGAAPEKEARNMDHLCLQVESFDAEAVMRHLKERGAKVEEPKKRYGAGGEGLSIYLYDPEDNLIELRAAP
ncbi:MAG TPA: VOC family protein [Burkholderiales bacterium]|nr:VOC family protein [Burkholderiales bacterium]